MAWEEALTKTVSRKWRDTLPPPLMRLQAHKKALEPALVEVKLNDEQGTSLQDARHEIIKRGLLVDSSTSWSMAMHLSSDAWNAAILTRIRP